MDQLQKKTQYAREIRDKDVVASSFLIKQSHTALGKNGKPYVNLVLTDKSGDLEAKIWDEVTQLAQAAVRDNLVWVEGRCQLFQGRRQVVVKQLQSLREDEVDLKDYLPPNHLDPELLYAELLGLVDTMEDPHYRALAQITLREDEEIAERFKRAPAAKTIHHAYPTGLLEHVVSITKILDHLWRHYQPRLDRDLLFLGGIFHDIGKIWELSYDRITDYTLEGRLIGHLVMGAELVERKIRLLESQGGRYLTPFPEEKRLLVKHVVLAHHGSLQYGSPKLPQCLEAVVIHMVDDLDSKVNAISRFMEADQNPGRWTGLNKQLERTFYKPDYLVEGS